MSRQTRSRARVAARLAAAAALSTSIAAARAAPAPTAAHAAAPAPVAAPAAATVMPVIDACPKVLEVRQSVVADVAGWTSVSPQESYPFARIAFYSGPPADDRRVVPSFENRTASGLHDGWMLKKQPAGYWVQCQYGNTAAVVIRKLEDENDFCVADYDPHFSTLVVKHWACMAGRPPSRPAPAPPKAKAPAGKAPPSWVHGP